MFFKWISIWLFVVGLLACGSENDADIKVGVLHSTSGTMAFSERDLVDILTFTIEEINAEGGVLGRPLRAVFADGQSDPYQFAMEAKRLIVQERVAVIFGCWTSSSRKAVKPMVEHYNNLLFYPVQYEGLEQSPNIFYTGATPNQQIIPSIHWALKHLGQKVYLVGSDYIFPHAANMMIKDLLASRGITVVGESYLPLGTQAVDTVIEEIRQLQPELILNTINGDTNIAFFKALNAQKGKISGKVMSYSIAESEVNTIGAEIMQGHYAAWNYFQSIDSHDNREFVAAFKQRFGADRVVNDPMEASYIGLKLWVQAVKAAGSLDSTRVRNALSFQSYNAPQGVVSIDMMTQHLWKTVRIGRILSDGQFDIVWSSNRPIRPSPYPSYKTKDEWEQQLRLMSSQ